MTSKSICRLFFVTVIILVSPCSVSQAGDRITVSGMYIETDCAQIVRVDEIDYCLRLVDKAGNLLEDYIDISSTVNGKQIKVTGKLYPEADTGYCPKTIIVEKWAIVTP
jgi:hypothetical protein